MERLMSEMVAMVYRLNIEHFEHLLAQQIDDIQRSTVTRLLAEERAKLAALENPKQGN